MNTKTAGFAGRCEFWHAGCHQGKCYAHARREWLSPAAVAPEPEPAPAPSQQTERASRLERLAQRIPAAVDVTDERDIWGNRIEPEPERAVPTSAQGDWCADEPRTVRQRVAPGQAELFG